MKTMQEQWREFRDQVYPKGLYPEGLPADQNRELHQAFFAGALCFDQTYTEIATTLPEETAVRELEKLKREVVAVCATRVATLKDRN